MSTSRPMRDLMVQVLATVMIPLTIAGTGLYYTRWQQNLSDLKTMIDLVSDENSEKRKFGIAMLEYLLKNNKVPVEFVAAQLDYANSSSDKQMLPLMEAALMKAADENPTVAETFRKALERLPSRLFVHAMTDQQRACITTMLLSLKDGDRAQISVPLIAQVNWDGKQHELRVLKDSDMERGKAIANMFASLGLDLKIINLTNIWDGAKKVRPNTFELWFGNAPLPIVCGGTAQPAKTQ
ncbi:hypothetical protein [Taklimakanibacter deserti]|uniref:hypothetical protein n=1 Tax=Taklimakanibacter deserti TaxID=2267839 RepID=UPI000E65796C